MDAKKTLQITVISLIYKFSFAIEKVDTDGIIKINKCCEKFEVLQDQLCVIVNKTETGEFTPFFANENQKIKFSFLIGNPICRSNQIWSVFDYKGSIDKLIFLDDGSLRHYTFHLDSKLNNNFNSSKETENDLIYYDYIQGQYCIDKGILNNGTNEEYVFAKVCSPHSSNKWPDSEYIFNSILKPIFDIISIIIFLVIAIVYFILPTLRDLIGNILTTICTCLLFSQAAILFKNTQLENYINFIILDTIIYVSFLSAFFWLNSFGYYIWKKFHSTNIFLRVTDGQKYCWYSTCIWGLTFLLSILAIFAHYFLDIPNYKYKNITSMESNQNTIGQLGVAIFFLPIGVTILIDLFFQLSTLSLIYKRNVYGHILQKLKSNFVMFSSLFWIMTLNWIFFILSSFGNKVFLYIFILLNGIQAPIIFHICILQQKHVKFLLKKTFCYNEPSVTNNLGHELTHMNDDNY